MSNNGTLARAAKVMARALGGQQPYGRSYARLVEELVQRSRLSVSGAERCHGDFRHLPSYIAGPWILEVARTNVLAAAFLTDVLATLSRYAEALDDLHQPFPSAACKRALTRESPDYFAEFEVPPGAGFHVRDAHHPDGVIHRPGFQGVALVEHCHLAWLPDRYAGGYGVIPEFGRCETLLGFDVLGLFLPGHGIVDGSLAPPAKPCGAPVGCEIPYGFIKRAWVIDSEALYRPEPPPRCVCHPRMDGDAAVDLALGALHAFDAGQCVAGSHSSSRSGW